MKEHDLALKDFESALALRPNYFKSYLNRANVFADLNRVDEAIRDYTKGIELQPRFFKAYSNRFAPIQKHPAAIFSVFFLTAVLEDTFTTR